ncbi:MAG: class I SAM-dependent methyltransferase [Methyloligellaceae bacterium]
MSIDIFDRDLLSAKRCRFAGSAEDYDFLLKRVAEDIADRLSAVTRKFSHALEVGAHHGVVGRLLMQGQIIDELTSMEECPALLNKCAGTKIQGDPENLPFESGAFDLVISALSLHFVNDLPGALLQIRRVLRPDGLFIGVMPGGRTLFELRESFAVAEEEIEGGVSPRVAPFVDVRDGGALLQRTGFALPVSDLDVVQVSYETPFHLMRELQRMGGSNILRSRSRKPLRRSTMMRMVEVYQQRFEGADGRIPATFELLNLAGWSPHESQQKPLQPGTAKTRLADALGVEEFPTGEKP